MRWAINFQRLKLFSNGSIDYWSFVLSIFNVEISLDQEFLKLSCMLRHMTQYNPSLRSAASFLHFTEAEGRTREESWSLWPGGPAANQHLRVGGAWPLTPPDSSSGFQPGFSRVWTWFFFHLNTGFCVLLSLTSSDFLKSIVSKTQLLFAAQFLSLGLLLSTGDFDFSH